MITFHEIDKQFIQDKYPKYFHEHGMYFRIIKDKCDLCIYGIIIYSENICESFWIMESFIKNAFTKEFFIALFKHLFGLGFKEIYTWTRCRKIIKTFKHFKAYGIEETTSPSWDGDSTKTWFVKRI